MTRTTTGPAPTSPQAAVALHSSYIWSVNNAITSGGSALADELADAYEHEAQSLGQHIPEARTEMAKGPRGGRRLSSISSFLTRSVNPPQELAPRARGRGPLGY